MSVDSTLETLHQRIEFLEAVICHSGHNWIAAADLDDGSQRQVCSNCGKIRIVPGAKKESKDESIPDVSRVYFLQSLVYEAANQYPKKELVGAANNLPNRFYIFEAFWDEYPEALLTESELQEVFAAAVRTFDGK